MTRHARRFVGRRTRLPDQRDLTRTTLVVVDTNVLVSGLVGSLTPPSQILDAWRGAKFTLIISEPILRELATTFERPYFRGRLTANERTENIALLRTSAVIVTITIPVRGVATHPEDDLILATALSVGAGYLVTGDRQLRALGTFGSTTIVTAREFVYLLPE